MSKFQRLSSLITGLLMLLGVALLAYDPEEGAATVMGLLGLSLLFSGIGTLRFYFTMARYMVGGKLELYKGIILFDLGAFTLVLADANTYFILFYLLNGLMFTGLVSILRAVEEKKMEASHWGLKLIYGLVSIILPIVGLFLLQSEKMIIYVYCFSLFNSALVRIAEAFKKTAIVYIQ